MVLYTITYNTNSTGATSSASTGTVAYTYNGHYSASSGGTQMISANGYITSNLTTTKYTANTTLYAQWTDGSTTLATITKEGYTCSWNTSSDGSGTTYTSGKTGYTTSTNVTLYAICSANSYKIAYELNNGDSGSNAPTSATYDSIVNISNPTKPVTVTGDVHSTGATVGNATSNTFDFAGWTATNLNTSTAKFGTNSSNVTSSWSSASTKVTDEYFKHLTDTSGSTVT